MINSIAKLNHYGVPAGIGLLILLAVAVSLSLRAPLYYPHVVIESGISNADVKVDFLRYGRPKIDDCQKAAALIANVILGTCPTCRVAMQRCPSKIESEYARLLSEEPVAFPTLRAPNGVVAYRSDNPENAFLACQETERLTAKDVSYRSKCYPPNTLRPLSGSPQLLPTGIWQGIFGLLFISLSGIVFAAYIKNFEYESFKRAFDVVFAVSSIIIFLPLFLIVPLAIKLIDWRCPVVVNNHWAVGKDGRLFQFHKFSTMVRNADKVLADLLARDPAMRKEWEEHHKLINDPRLLPLIGAFLRKYSINELPQLFNVVKGEMSIVGPRPISRAEEAKYEKVGGADLVRLRHSIRPGITGLWQVSGRNNISYRERVLIDAHYLQNRSLVLDFKILLKTVTVVVRATGAY